MPREGAVVLSDVVDAALGLARLTDLLAEIADCPKAEARAVHDPCKARYEPFRVTARWPSR